MTSQGEGLTVKATVKDLRATAQAIQDQDQALVEILRSLTGLNEHLLAITQSEQSIAEALVGLRQQLSDIGTDRDEMAAALVQAGRKASSQINKEAEQLRNALGREGVAARDSVGEAATAAVSALEVAAAAYGEKMVQQGAEVAPQLASIESSLSGLRPDLVAQLAELTIQVRALVESQAVATRQEIGEMVAANNDQILQELRNLRDDLRNVRNSSEETAGRGDDI